MSVEDAAERLRMLAENIMTAKGIYGQEDLASGLIDMLRSEQNDLSEEEYFQAIQQGVNAVVNRTENRTN